MAQPTNSANTSDNTGSDQPREITAYPTDPRDRIASQLVGGDFQVESPESEEATLKAREEIVGDTVDTEDAMGFDEGNVRYQTLGEISLDEIGSAVDLSASQLDVNEMNEEEASESGYVGEDEEDEDETSDEGLSANP